MSTLELSQRGGRLLVAVLLLLATAAVATGAAIERSRPAPLVVAGIVLSVIAAGAAWFLGERRGVLGAVALLCLAFAALDVAELARRAADDAGAATAAVAAASLHTAAAAAAGALARRDPPAATSG